MARLLIEGLKWAGIGATAGGLFVGVKHGASEMVKWITVGSALWLLFSFASGRNSRG